MTDEEIIEQLRRERTGRSASELAELLNVLTDGGLSHGTLITFFKRAFPEIPLRVLQDAGAWHRVGAAAGTDAELNQLLSPWLR